jgi:hypothetical protein
MSFSDDHLKRLKEGLNESDDWEAFNFNCNLMPKDIKALLARLEAAEVVCDTVCFCINHECNPFPCEAIFQARDVWRKSAGKS